MASLHNTILSFEVDIENKDEFFELVDQIDALMQQIAEFKFSAVIKDPEKVTEKIGTMATDFDTVRKQVKLIKHIGKERETTAAYLKLAISLLEADPDRTEGIKYAIDQMERHLVWCGLLP